MKLVQVLSTLCGLPALSGEDLIIIIIVRQYKGNTKTIQNKVDKDVKKTQIKNKQKTTLLLTKSVIRN